MINAESSRGKMHWLQPALVPTLRAGTPLSVTLCIVRHDAKLRGSHAERGNQNNKQSAEISENQRSFFSSFFSFFFPSSAFPSFTVNSTDAWPVFCRIVSWITSRSRYLPGAILFGRRR